MCVVYQNFHSLHFVSFLCSIDSSSCDYLTITHQTVLRMRAEDVNKTHIYVNEVFVVYLMFVILWLVDGPANKDV